MHVILKSIFELGLSPLTDNLQSTFNALHRSWVPKNYTT